MLDLHKSFYFLVRNFLVRKKGASAVTYALLIMMVASGAIVTFSITGGSVEDVFQIVTREIDPNAGGGGEGGGGAAPTFTTTIPDATIAENGTYGPTGFTIADSDTDVGSLTVTATTSNAGIVPPNRIDLGGSGGSRTISLTPEPNASGTVTITVTVSDGTNTGSDSFVLTITPDAAPNFIASGHNATISSSADEASWSSQQIGDSAGFLLDIAYDGTTYVASGRDGSSNPIFYLSTDGASWAATTGTINATQIPGRLAYGNGIFVATGDDNVIVSTDGGVNWNEIPFGFSVGASGVAYGAGKFVVSGYNGFATSTDGTTWSPVTLPFASPCDADPYCLEDIAYGGGFFVAAGYDYNTYYPYAIYADGNDVQNWSEATFPAVTTDHDIYSISYGNGTFIAAGYNSVIWTTTNPASWTKSYFSESDGYFWQSAAYAGGSYVVVGNSGAIFTSPDLSTWTYQNSGTASNLYGVVGGNPTANGGPSDPEGNAPPVIGTPIANETISPGGTFGPDLIDVTDDNDTPSSLTIDVTTNNPTLTPQSGIVVDQSGSTPTLTITPAPGEEGISSVTVTVTDGGGRYTTMGFTLTVTDQQKIYGSNTAGNDLFGEAVAMDGSTLIVGSRAKDSLYVFDLSGGTWTQSAIITTVHYTSAIYPWSIAISGDTIVAGHRGAGTSGSADVYVKSGGTWSLEQTLTPSDAGPSVDKFGYAVDIKDDTIIVGAPDSTSGVVGAAYIFDRSGGTWSQTIKLTSPTYSANGNRFGYEVGIGGGISNKVALVTQNAISSNNSVTFFGESSGWSDIATYAGDNNSDFGISGAMDPAGNYAVVGDQYNGNTYVFTRGASFTLTNTIHLPGISEPGVPIDNYCGRVTDIDATNILISCPSYNAQTFYDGYAKIYNTNGTLQKTITPYDGWGDVRYFGYDIAISGSRLAISDVSDEDKGSNAGAVYADKF